MNFILIGIIALVVIIVIGAMFMMIKTANGNT